MHRPITESVTRSRDRYGERVVKAAISYITCTGDYRSSVCSERSKQVLGQAKHLIGQISEEETSTALRSLARTSQKLIDSLEQT